MLKKIFLTILTTLFLGTHFSGIAHAQAATMKIGVIDLQQIMAQSTQLKQAREQLEAQFKPKQQKIMTQQEKLKAKMEKLQRDDAVMSVSQKKSLQDEIIQDQQQLNKQGQNYQQSLNQAQDKAMQAFFSQVQTAVDEYAGQEHYDLILQKDGVPFVAAKLDITDKIIAKLKR